MDENEILVFPSNFKFGSAVAAYQVEGDSGERKTDWDAFLRENPEVIPNDQKGPEWWKKGKAEHDLKMMADLGLKIQRLSFEWGRIEPEKGVINHEAVDRYKEIIDKIYELGMSPMVTLNHFVLPEWVAKEGSWESDKIVHYFQRYVEYVISKFPKVTHWVTINEPNIVVALSYLTNYFPPARNNIFSAIKARHNMIAAHRRAYHTIKNFNPNAKVGVAFAFRWDRAASANDPFERIYAMFTNYLAELSYVDAMLNTSDFIGCNYYTGYFLNLNLLKWKFSFGNHNRSFPAELFLGEVKTPDAYVSDYKWPIVPDFLLNILHILHHTYKLPIIITENGIADYRDKNRALYILTHLVAIWRAIHEGIPVNDYFHWSTVDNLEWTEGYSKKFGLIAVDPHTGERKLRKSAHLYKEIATTGKIDINKMVNEYIDEDDQREHAKKMIRKLLRGELSRRIKST